MALHWIPIIWSILGASPPPSPLHLSTTLCGRIGKLWVVVVNSKEEACHWYMMLSLVWDLYCLTETQCAVFHTVNRNFGFVGMVFVRHMSNRLHSEWLCMLCGHVSDPLSSMSWIRQPSCLYLYYIWSSFPFSTFCTELRYFSNRSF